MIYVTTLDMNGNEIKNLVFEKLPTDPADPKEGQAYYNTTDKVIRIYTDGTWKSLGTSDSLTALTARVTTVEGKVQTLETNYTAIDGRVTTAQNEIDALETNLNDNYYNKNTIDGKIAGVFHFKGSANKFEGGNLYSDATTTIDTKEVGDVYTVGEKEYAWTGNEWIELGFTVDLSPVTNRLDAVEGKANTNETNITNLTQKVTTLENKPDYTLPTATADTLGGIKVGGGLQISAEGTLSATGGGVADSVNWTGVVDRPTKLSQFTNDTGFIDNTVNNLANYYKKDETYTQNEIDTKINAKGTLKVQQDTLNAGDLTKSVTVTGTKVVSVTCLDAVTNEVLIAGITINGTTATVTINSAYQNNITVLVIYE